MLVHKSWSKKGNFGMILAEYYLVNAEKKDFPQKLESPLFYEKILILSIQKIICLILSLNQESNIVYTIFFTNFFH